MLSDIWSSAPSITFSCVSTWDPSLLIFARIIVCFEWWHKILLVWHWLTIASTLHVTYSCTAPLQSVAHQTHSGHHLCCLDRAQLSCLPDTPIYIHLYTRTNYLLRTMAAIHLSAIVFASRFGDFIPIAIISTIFIILFVGVYFFVLYFSLAVNFYGIY